MMRIRENKAHARAQVRAVIFCALVVVVALGFFVYATVKFFHITRQGSETSLFSNTSRSNSCPEFDTLVEEENARMDEKLGDAGVRHPQFSEYAQEHAENMAGLYRAIILICP